MISKSNLLAAGAPAKYVNLYKESDLSCSQFLIQSEDEKGNVKSKPVLPRKQVGWLQRCLDDVFHEPYVLHLSDNYQGDIARNFGVRILSTALQSLATQRCPFATKPMWLRLDQSFNPQFDQSKRYSLIVVDNVFPDSTPVKIEKLRDLIAINDGCSFVVICPGGNPLALAEKFYLPMTYAALLRNERAVVSEREV